jgi:peptidoglycan/xylan/chitin deacetylase (PgdA/CDA1 family)
MFLHGDIKGYDLPAKTLCLTYDDGPGESPDDESGPKTAALAKFLGNEGISATFFIIGRHAEQHPQSLVALRRYGHAIGNHTYSHPGLVSVAEKMGDVVGELRKTDALVRPWCAEQSIFFRAPFGNWRQVNPATKADRAQSLVADILNASGAFRDYIGPVNWDISAEDFSFWRRGESAAAAATAYLAQIDRVGHGIVLLHDSSDDEAIRRQNRTLELTMRLVPVLRYRGYKFVSLYQLPQVERLLTQDSRETNHEPWSIARDGNHDHAQSTRGDAPLTGEAVRVA